MRKRKCGSRKLKIEFHRTYLIMALGFVLSGYYLNLIVFTSLIFVHEMGHYLMARINKFNVEGVVIYPYGGMVKLNDMVNRNICEELLIATFGVIFQYLFYLLIVLLCKMDIVREYVCNLYMVYNNQMIFFNLLPIWPLDGGKIVNLLMMKFFPYYRANNVTILWSVMIILLIVILGIYENSYSNIMVMGLLFSYLYKFFSKRKYLYQRFLLERYLYRIEYPRIKVINNIRGMFKNKSHVIRTRDGYVGERVVLGNLFVKK